MNTVTKLYKVEFNFDIEPTWKDQAPQVRIWLDEQMFWDGEISDTQPFSIEHYFPAGQHRLTIELYDKHDHDAYQGIRIQDLCINGISDDRFIWQGRYRPFYPEPWATQQRSQGIELQQEIGATDYLGWNGKWALDFTVPVFTWIHQIQNLGWIYD